MSCSFVEAYPGGPLGYVTVTRASGEGPMLLVRGAWGLGSLGPDGGLHLRCQACGSMEAWSCHSNLQHLPWRACTGVRVLPAAPCCTNPLQVLPAPGTPTSFEAWRPLRGDDGSDAGFGFEGHHELLLHTRAWAENEW